MVKNAKKAEKTGKKDEKIRANLSVLWCIYSVYIELVKKRFLPLHEHVVAQVRLREGRSFGTE